MVHCKTTIVIIVDSGFGHKEHGCMICETMHKILRDNCMCLDCLLFNAMKQTNTFIHISINTTVSLVPKKCSVSKEKNKK